MKQNHLITGKAMYKNGHIHWNKILGLYSNNWRQFLHKYGYWRKSSGELCFKNVRMKMPMNFPLET